MERLVPLARIAIAISMAAFAIQQFVYGAFVTRFIPDPPAWVPAHQALAYISGAVVLLAALAILSNRQAYPAALLLAYIGTFSGMLIDLPRLRIDYANGGLWTSTGKAFALSAGALLVAGSLPKERWKIKAAEAIPYAPYLLAAFFVICGIEHFIYVQFVATLVPAWIPFHEFWTYFAGVALIAGGIGMIVPRTARLAGALSSLMVFLWLIMLHIPRALAAPQDANETTAVFEALAISATALLLAASSKELRKAPNTSHRQPAAS
jgi:uncharacterized membrane protein